MEVSRTSLFGEALFLAIYPSVAPEASKKLCRLGLNVDCDCNRRGRNYDAAEQAISQKDCPKYNDRLLPEMTQRIDIGVDSVDDDIVGSFLPLLHRETAAVVANSAVLYEGATSGKLHDDAPSEMTRK